MNKKNSTNFVLVNCSTTPLKGMKLCYCIIIWYKNMLSGKYMLQLTCLCKSYAKIKTGCENVSNRMYANSTNVLAGLQKAYVTNSYT